MWQLTCTGHLKNLIWPSPAIQAHRGCCSHYSWMQGFYWTWFLTCCLPHSSGLAEMQDVGDRGHGDFYPDCSGRPGRSSNAGRIGAPMHIPREGNPCRIENEFIIGVETPKLKKCEYCGSSAEQRWGFKQRQDYRGSYGLYTSKSEM